MALVMQTPSAFQSACLRSLGNLVAHTKLAVVQPDGDAIMDEGVGPGPYLSWTQISQCASLQALIAGMIDHPTSATSMAVRLLGHLVKQDGANCSRLTLEECSERQRLTECYCDHLL